MLTIIPPTLTSKWGAMLVNLDYILMALRFPPLDDSDQARWDSTCFLYHMKCSAVLLNHFVKIKSAGSGGIRTHASEETGALNQRLRPLGHATVLL